MNKQLEDIYVDMITPQSEEVLEEGLFDRLGAQASGLKAGAKTFMGNLGRAGKGLVTGGNVQQQSVKDSATKAKLQNITQTFQKEMTSLFGDKWQSTYPELAKGLSSVDTPVAPATAAPTTTTTEPTAATPTPPEAKVEPTSAGVDKTKPLAKGQTVTGSGGKMTAGKYQVVETDPTGQNLTVQPVSNEGKPYGKPTKVTRKDIVESQKTTLSETYSRMLEVPTL